MFLKFFTFLPWEVVVLQKSYLSAYCFYLLSHSVIWEPLFHMFIFIVAEPDVAGMLAPANKILVQVMGVFPLTTR